MIQVLQELLAIAEQVIGEPISPEQALMTAGLDSLGAVELRSAVAQHFHVSVPATLAFDFPTLQVSRALDQCALHCPALHPAARCAGQSHAADQPGL